MFLRQLGVKRLAALIGGSYGGLQVMDWITRCPDEMDKACLIATSASLNTQALAFDVVGRASITDDPAWNGGDYYEKDKNYRALTAWSAMPEEDRSKFTFNYDALDLLIDPNFGGTKNKKYQYDSSAATLTGAQANNATYSLPTPIDYTATKYGASVTLTNGITLTRGESTLTNQTTVQEGDELTREVFESLPNEQRHYAPVLVSKAGDYYVVNTSFVHVETPYAAGSTISSEEFERLSHDEQTNYITQLTFTTSDFPSGGNRTYYFCREEYKIGEKGDGHAVTALTGKGGTTGDWDVGDTVPVGALISDASYTALPNKQTQYTIHGVSPMETSTLFVSRNSDINDLSEEKIRQTGSSAN